VLDIASILDRLDRLRRADRSHQILGAASHRYRLEPTLDGRAILAFEAEHRISLPEDYATFVCCIGNGGAGPGYGMFPVGRYADQTTAGDLAAPFRHRERWNDDDLSEDDYHADSLVDGALPINHLGCGMISLLVLNGPERGNLWLDDRGSSGGIAPYLSATTDPHSRIDFARWYMEWLHESLARVGD
jgi:hypothetical protein